MLLSLRLLPIPETVQLPTCATSSINTAETSEDFSSDDETYEITTEPDDLYAVREALEKLGYKVESAEEDKIPQNYVTLENEDDIKNMNLLIEHLEDSDDVQEIYHNWENCDD